MKLKFSTIFTAIFLASCTTVANRVESKPIESKSSAAKHIGGMSSKKPENEEIKIDPKKVDATLLGQLKQMVLDSSSGGPSADQNYQKAIEIVESKLSPSDLNKVIEDGDFGFLRAHAYLEYVLAKWRVSGRRNCCF